MTMYWLRCFRDPTQVVFVQTLIESAGIATNLSESMRGAQRAFYPRIFVRRADAEHAAELVADFEKNGRRAGY